MNSEIQNAIEVAIKTRILENSKASVIIIHPSTYENFMKEVKVWMGDNLKSIYNPQDGSVKYRGLRIIRSYDVKENEILVY